MSQQHTEHECESVLSSIYNDLFACLYASLWDERLAARHCAAVDRLFPDGLDGMSVLDAAAGTGGLSLNLIARGAEVTANEYCPSMLQRLLELRAQHNIEENLRILEPGSLWKHLGDALGDRRFDLVLCTGTSLAHCDNTDSGNFQDSMQGLLSAVKPGGHLLVDCRQYAEDGVELLADGSSRDISASESRGADWRDGRGNQRHGTVAATVEAQPDRTLVSVVNYTDKMNYRYVRTWTIRTWPVGREDIEASLAAENTELIDAVPGESSGAVEYLLFKKLD